VVQLRVLRKIFGSKAEEVRGEWKNCIMRIYRSRKYYLCDQIEENETGGACGMCGGQEKRMQRFDDKFSNEP
jgi:hypothetical protein